MAVRKKKTAKKKKSIQVGKNTQKLLDEMDRRRLGKTPRKTGR